MADRDNNEMEQIQRGLERFLEKELNIDRDADSQAEEPYPGVPDGYSDDRYASYDEAEEPYPGEIGGYSDDRYASYDEAEEPYPEEDVEYPAEEEEYPEAAGNFVKKARGQTRLRQQRQKPSREKRLSRPVRQQERPQSAERQAYESSRQRLPQKKTQAREDTAMAKKGRRKKKRKKKYGLLKFLIVLAVIIGLLLFAWYQMVGSVYNQMNFEEIEAVTDQPMEEDGVVNILLIGNDSRQNSTDGRSDAMILLSVSSRTKTIFMTSLLRDMYVEIPGRDGNRLNAAYSYGGPQLLMETIEANFGIQVNRYVSVNFEAFANLIDAVDGVDLELSKEEIEYVNGYLVEYNMLTGREQGTDNMDPDAAGLVHLNGPQALAYCRNRYIGTDFGRTERQRKVLTAAFRKAPAAMLNDYEGLMDGILPNLTTNLTQNECFQLSLMAGKLLTYDIVSDSIPQPGTYSNATIRKMAVLEVDFEANIRYLKEKIYGEVEE